MSVTASAPGKAILFGEHAVVYSKPAIALAVDRRVKVTITDGNQTIEGKEDNIIIKVPDLDLTGYICADGSISHTGDGNTGILEFVKSAFFKLDLKRDLSLEIDLGIPIGAGLGSSAAVTVATLAAASKFNQIEMTKMELAEIAHQVELEVQGSASILDTTLSVYGGLIYLSKDKKPIPLEFAGELPLVVGYTYYSGNTGKLVGGVKKLRDRHPSIIKPIIDSIERLTNEARQAILKNDQKRIGELMNINHGLLDAMGVNTLELSSMVYKARKAGALGSKITGAGGGGSIIAYCPEKAQEVLDELNALENAFQVALSPEGVIF